MRIGVLSGGGDAPGLNAVIRAVTKTAIFKYGWEVTGIIDGFEGLLSPTKTRQLTSWNTRGILFMGGTILGTTNRGNPFAHKTIMGGKEIVEDMSSMVLNNISETGIDALVVIGGDGSLKIGSGLQKLGVPVIGVPKTIDNDLMATHVTFGFQTAVDTATDALDKLHTTAESHQRVIVLEVMGRYAGWIALEAGIAGSADVILIPEIPFSMEKVAERLLERKKAGSKSSIVVVAEGAKARGRRDGRAREGGRRVRAAAGRHGRDRGERDQQVHPDRDARHRAGASAARRQPLSLRPHPGDALRRGGRGPYRREEVRRDGVLPASRYHVGAAREGHQQPEARGTRRRTGEDGRRHGSELRQMSLFFLTFFAVYGGLHAYALFSVPVRPWRSGPSPASSLALFMLLMVLSPFLIRLLERNEFELPARVLSYVAYLWMAFALPLFLRLPRPGRRQLVGLRGAHLGRCGQGRGLVLPARLSFLRSLRSCAGHLHLRLFFGADHPDRAHAARYGEAAGGHGPAQDRPDL